MINEIINAKSYQVWILILRTHTLVKMFFMAMINPCLLLRPSLLSELLPQAYTLPTSVRNMVPSIPQNTSLITTGSSIRSSWGWQLQYIVSVGFCKPTFICGQDNFLRYISHYKPLFVYVIVYQHRFCLLN